MDSPRTAPHQLTCRQLVELVTDFLEGALEGPQLRAFEAHLAECAPCRAYLDQMRASVRAVRATAQLEQRPEMAALLHAFREFQRTR